MRSWREIWPGRNLALLWTGQVLSQAGDSVYMIALMWLMLELTGSKSLTGLAAMAAYLPTLLFGLFAGAIADRHDRRRVMITADALRFLLVLAVPLAAGAGSLHASVGAFLLGIVTFAVASVATLFGPARDALIPDIVEPSKLGLANGMIQTSWQLALLVGPLLAGLMLGWVSLVDLFYFDAATFLASLLCVLVLPRTAGAVKRAARGATIAVRAQLLEGLRHSFSDPRLRALVLLTAAYNFLLMGLPFVATPIYVREVLDGRPETYAWLQAVYAGGMLPGIWLAHRLAERVKLGSLILVGIVLDGLTYVPFWLVDSVGPALAFMALHSTFIPLIIVPRATLVQRLAPRSLRGRTFAIMNVCVTGFSALSAGTVGLIAEVMPVGELFLLFGLLTASAGLVGMTSRHLRNAT